MIFKHKEDKPKVVFHTVFESEKGKDMCVADDDSDLFILLLDVSEHIKSHIYYRQDKSTGKDGTAFHEINSLAGYLGESICNALLAFHVLTCSDYTSTFLAQNYRLRKEKTLGEAKYNMLFIKKKRILEFRVNFSNFGSLAQTLKFIRPQYVH